MSKKEWSFELADGRHTVELDYGYWSGKREITIDGLPYESSRNIWDTGSVHHFEISGVPCILHIKINGYKVSYIFYVDGKIV
ncbi:hypothetical protein ACFLXT_03005 [Chloroflexota bacterium]